MFELKSFYSEHATGTHLALRWKGRIRYIVPQEHAGQIACWRLFQPGNLELPLRAMALFPSLLGVARCTEDEKLIVIREAIGGNAGLSCCRVGALSAKQMILFLDKKTGEPQYLVKAGYGAEVTQFLQNEAHWLRVLGEQKELAIHVPGFVTFSQNADFCFVAQLPVPGRLSFVLGTPQMEFLGKLQNHSSQILSYQDSALYRNFNARLKDLQGLLSEEWTIRIGKAMQQIANSLGGQGHIFVTAHNDFTPWNVRIEDGRAYVHDWEFASCEQLPLFDPLHFVLTPMALRREPATSLLKKIRQIEERCRAWLGEDKCRCAGTQSLAYLVNVCTLYLWTVHGDYGGSHPVLDTYGELMDLLCARSMDQVLLANDSNV